MFLNIVEGRIRILMKEYEVDYRYVKGVDYFTGSGSVIDPRRGYRDLLGDDRGSEGPRSHFIWHALLILGVAALWVTGRILF
jgi:hypothetical protein